LNYFIDPPMDSFDELIRSCADFYIGHVKYKLDKMQDYEVVCKTVLHKYTRLATVVERLCKIQNAAPSKRGRVKRLQPHVIKNLI
jgi:hypothetical protein